MLWWTPLCFDDHIPKEATDFLFTPTNPAGNIFKPISRSVNITARVSHDSNR
jgi:hypothetical protein